MTPSRKTAIDLAACEVRRSARRNPRIPLNPLAIPEPRALAEELFGAQVLEQDRIVHLEHELAGFAEPRERRIGVSLHHGDAVARFTLYHEIGHLHLHRDHDITFRDLPGAANSEWLYSDPQLLQMEQEANRFAAELMMPEELVWERFKLLWRVCPVRQQSIDDEFCMHLRWALDEDLLRRVGLRKANLSPSILRGLPSRKLAWLLANGRPVEATWSLADAFGSSPTATTVRLLSLGLVQRGSVRSPRRDSFRQKVADVFVSYHREDRAVVSAIIDDMRDRGTTVWSDQDLTPGQQWVSVLEKKLEHSRSLAVFIGPSGISEFQELELSAALSQAGGPPQVIPILLPGVAAHYEVPPLLRSFQILDARQKVDAVAERLLHALSRVD